jgi:YVTN family beta-propeller protein
MRVRRQSWSQIPRLTARGTLPLFAVPLVVCGLVGTPICSGLGFGTGQLHSPIGVSFGSTSAGEEKHGLVSLGQLSLGPPGSEPIATAFDNASDEFYVVTAFGWVDVVSAGTLQVAKSIYLGNSSGPESIAYDSRTGTIFVGTYPGNLLVLSTSSNTVVANISVGYEPITLAFDYQTGDLYAGMGIESAFSTGTSGDYNVTVVNGSTYAISQFESYPIIPAIYPFQVIPDPNTGSLIVLGDASAEPWNAVAAFSATNGSVIWDDRGSLSGPLYTGETLDLAGGVAYLTNCENNTLVGLNVSSGVYEDSFSLPPRNGECSSNGVLSFDASSDKVLIGEPWADIQTLNVSNRSLSGPLGVGGQPGAFAFDYPLDSPVVLSADTAALAVLSANASLVTRWATVGGGPTAIAFDPSSNRLYVTGSDNVTVLNATSRQVLGRISVGYLPSAVLYDPTDSDVFVANADSGNVTVISTVNNTAVASMLVDPNPYALAWDNESDTVFVACMNLTSNPSEGYVDGISGSSLSVDSRFAIGEDTFPDGVAYVPSTGELVVAHADAEYAPFNLSVLSSTTGLQVGSISLPEGAEPGAMVFDNVTGELYVANAGFGNNGVNTPDDFVVNVSSLTVVGQFSVGEYQAGLAESAQQGLLFAASLDNDTVEALNAENLNISGVAALPPGSMPLSLCYDTDDGVLIVADWGSDSITFLSYEEVYPVQLSETGLPPGTNWSLEINDTTLASTSPRIVVFEPNGTYSFTIGIVSGFTSDPASGEVMVAGLGENVTVAFERQFEVTFEAAGLPTGTPWAVTLNGSTNSSSTTSVDFAEPNGTWAFGVGPVTGYTVTPPTGNVTVNGSNVTVAIRFTLTPPETYSVEFAESGLPSGTNWSIRMNGTLGGSVASIVTFTEPNGTYNYSVGPVKGYMASPSSGFVTVKGTPVNVSITFASVPPPLQASVFLRQLSATGVCGPHSSYSLTVQLYGNGSEGTPPYTYSWNFGDGSPASTLQNPEHTYAYASPEDTATLTVTDHLGIQANTSVTIPDVTAACSIGGYNTTWTLLVVAIGAGVGTAAGLATYRRRG